MRGFPSLTRFDDRPLLLGGMRTTYPA